MTTPASFIARVFPVLGVAAVVVGSACQSPVDDDLIASLGEELPGLEEGVFHRYGQPCLACHGGPNTSAPSFWVGGTVFATPDDNIPVLGATVTIVDATGNKFVTSTNCAGNFFFNADELETTVVKPVPQMVFPLHAEVECPTYLPDGKLATETRRNVMGTRINREGSCNACHENTAPSQTGPGRIYCAEAQPAVPYKIPQGCAGGPK